MPQDAGTGGEIVYFSSKKAEEVGFEKFAKRQARLQGIHVIVLDHMRIHGEVTESEKSAITETCGHVTELDLGSNLFEHLDEILGLCALFPKLSRVTLDGNRFSVHSTQGSTLKGVKTLSLSDTWLSWTDVSAVAAHFPHCTELYATHNGYSQIDDEPLPARLKRLVLSENSFEHLVDIKLPSQCQDLEELVLKHCRISGVSSGTVAPNTCIRSIDLSYNRIASWSFFDSIHEAFPQLDHLHVGGNPIFQGLVSAEGRPLTADDGYMLTIARMAQLNFLNYSKISEKERLNAETYYLGQIAVQLANAPRDQASKVLREHPRWKELCEEYGEPTFREAQKGDEIAPNSLAARLVSITFKIKDGYLPAISPRTWIDEVPKTLSIYSLLGLVGKRVQIMPLSLRLIWETGERDPIGSDADYTGPEWWDSSDEEDQSTSDGAFITRDVELVPSTRALGTYIESREARVRVEVKA